MPLTMFPGTPKQSKLVIAVAEFSQWASSPFIMIRHPLRSTFCCLTHAPNHVPRYTETIQTVIAVAEFSQWASSPFIMIRHPLRSTFCCLTHAPNHVPRYTETIQTRYRRGRVLSVGEFTFYYDTAPTEIHLLLPYTCP